MDETEDLAKAIADQLGRDWNDCGAYERQAFLDEARRRIDGEAAGEGYDPYYDAPLDFYL